MRALIDECIAESYQWEPGDEPGNRRDVFLRLPIGGVYCALREVQSAARRGDGAAELSGGFDPLLDDDFYVGESFLVGLSVGGATGKFRDLGDKSLVGLTPINDNFGSRHQHLQPSGS